MGTKKVVTKAAVKKAAKKKIDPKADRRLELINKVASLETTLSSLQNELDELENDPIDEAAENQFIKDFKALQKEIAPQRAAIKAARKEIAKLAEAAGVPASYEDNDMISHTYIPRSLAKKVDKLSEDFLDIFADDNRISFDDLVGAHSGWYASYF